MLDDESDSAENLTTKRKTKEFKCNVIKRAGVKNERYVNWKGNIAEPKRHGEDCKCKRRCMSNVSEEEMCELYSGFVTFDTKDEQGCYLQSMIELQPIVRRRSRPNTSPDTKKPKSNSFKYV
ncbi:hypothetical protein C0J52_07958 [Blattella germanica]|nr:hypothetical protein C0J52_07958 [Blattella germanica]